MTTSLFDNKWKGKYRLSFHFARPCFHGGGMQNDSHLAYTFPDGEKINNEEDMVRACAAWKKHTPSAYLFEAYSPTDKRLSTGF